MKTHLLRSALVAVATLIICAAPQVSFATLFGRVVAEKAAEPVVAPAGEKCCPEPCIKYIEHRPCKKICCTCDPPHTVVLKIKDPCTCCVYDVPVCVPACCTEAPCVDDHCGLFGRYVYEYDWCCGYKVKVVIKKCGDMEVHTYGH